ncbi:MAG: lysine exporter LysO family protein [Duncaniella sp.]|nr:lysine exporter LysO family protein [Duncaniella sp.]
MKGSLIVAAIFIAGIVIGVSDASIQSYLPAELSQWLLYALVIQIGITLGYEGNLRKIIKNISIRSMLLPMGTICGTLLFSAIAGAIVGGWNICDYLAVGSGLGYYSLSSVLIIDIKSQEIGSQAATKLGMLALMVNIIREMTALICGPWLAKIFGKFAPTAAAGVTSMDVTLPMILRCTGQEMFPIAIMHGVVLEIGVPLLVTLFASI